MIRAEYGGVYKNVSSAFAEHNNEYKRVIEIYAEKSGVYRKVYKLFTSAIENMGYGATLIQGRSDLAGARAGTFAVVAGGNSTSTTLTPSYYVDAFDADGVSRKTDTLGTTSSYRRVFMMGAHAGTTAFLAGGSNTNYMSDVWTYNSSLVKSSASGLYRYRAFGAEVTFNDRATFAGGHGRSPAILSGVETYTEDKTRSSLTDLSVARFYVSGNASNDMMVIVGGYTDESITASKVVDIYTKDGVRTSINLAHPRVRARVLRVGEDFAVIYGATDGSHAAEKISKDLVITQLPDVQEVTRTAVVNVDDTTYDIGGYSTNEDGSLDFKSVARYFDKDFVYHEIECLNTARSNTIAVSIGKKIIVAGGAGNEPNRLNTTEILKINI